MNHKLTIHGKSEALLSEEEREEEYDRAEQETQKDKDDELTEGEC